MSLLESADDTAERLVATAAGAAEHTKEASQAVRLTQGIIVIVLRTLPTVITFVPRIGRECPAQNSRRHRPHCGLDMPSRALLNSDFAGECTDR